MSDRYYSAYLPNTDSLSQDRELFSTYSQSWLYNALPAREKGALIAKEAVESAGIGGAIGSKVSIASIVGKHRGSAIPVPEPIVASNGLTYKSNPKHTPGGMEIAKMQE
ncbi:hypothetical protein [Photorhabdus sp. RM323S]|uniref:hypothetical protein n=1 Tax=Photorhabdus sp. RM323S TaxID=3342828 RepID=UPI0036DD93CF